jgi:elongation factor G
MAKDKGLDLTRVRNIGVIAHIDAGKTTTTEHLLYYSGAKHKLGGVDEGTTETDYDPEEQARGITIYSACVPFQWAGHTINLIDTPGHVDFTAEVERSLRVLDGAIVVFDGQKGVEAQSETVWRQANRYGVPRLVFVNKMDVVGANFAQTLKSIHTRLTPHPEEHGRPVPIVIPIGSGSEADSRTPFRGVIDLIEMKAKFFDAGDLGKTVRTTEIPEENLLEAQEYREKLFDALTAHDEKDLITSAVLEGQEPDPEKVRQLVREQCLARKIYPVLAGSGREHIGIQPLLDAVTLYLPSPLDRPPVVGTNLKGKEEKRKPDPKEPFCGLVFKAAWHPSGNRFFIRVYSGMMKPNMRAYNPRKDIKENIAKLFHVHADPARGLEEVESGPAGDIVCVIGLKDTATGDTLCETAHPIILEPITFAEAVVSQSIEPESGADKDKLALALEVLQLEDPTFKVRTDKDTGQTLMSGMGTLHLEVKRHRLERDFRLKVRVGKPRVSYREMLKTPRTVEVKVDKLGDKPTYAELKVSFTNFKSDKPVAVFNMVDTETNPIPPAFLAAVEKTLQDTLQTGELGYPMMNAQARILEAKFDPQLSTEDAFVAAAIRAYREATEGNVLLLEPIMKVTVTTPQQFMGNITGDLSRRRGQIESQDMSESGDMAEIVALVPLSELFTYANEVRSLSQGRAAMSMEPHSYEPAPDDVLRKLLGE